MSCRFEIDYKETFQVRKLFFKCHLINIIDF
jgi:hypothetical protein